MRALCPKQEDNIKASPVPHAGVGYLRRRRAGVEPGQVRQHRRAHEPGPGSAERPHPAPAGPPGVYGPQEVAPSVWEQRRSSASCLAGGVAAAAVLELARAKPKAKAPFVGLTDSEVTMKRNGSELEASVLPRTGSSDARKQTPPPPPPQPGAAALQEPAGPGPEPRAVKTLQPEPQNSPGSIWSL